MNHKLMHRIDQIEAEMTCRGDECVQGRKPCPTPHLCMDLRHVATGPAVSHIKASDLDGMGNECALPIVVNDIKPAGRDWGAIGMTCAVVAAVLFVVAVICPTVPLR